jgi:hypothetical protein
MIGDDAPVHHQVVFPSLPLFADPPCTQPGRVMSHQLPVSGAPVSGLTSFPFGHSAFWDSLSTDAILRDAHPRVSCVAPLLAPLQNYTAVRGSLLNEFLDIPLAISRTERLHALTAALQ